MINFGDPIKRTAKTQTEEIKLSLSKSGQGPANLLSMEK
jgi:hypothetical protein